MRSFAIFLISTGLCSCATVSQDETNIIIDGRDLAGGYWGIVPDADAVDVSKINCNDTPLTVTISADQTAYTSKSVLSSDTAKILEFGENFIRIQYDGETRINDDGSLHIWTMQFLTPDSFVWARQDWIKDGEITESTAPRKRCFNKFID